MTKRVIHLEIQADATSCAEPGTDKPCPFLRRSVGSAMGICMLFPVSTSVSYTQLKVVEGRILRCELCRKAEDSTQPTVFLNATGLCPLCGARFITSYPPQEVPPVQVRCHSCEARMGPREIRQAVEAYKAYKAQDGQRN